MDCPDREITACTLGSPEEIVDSESDRETGYRGVAVYRENLIYLSFAAHLAEEDAEEWSKAA